MKKFTTLFLPILFYLFQAQAQTNAEHVQKEMKSFSYLMKYGLYSVSSNNYDVNYYRCDWTVDPAIRFISGSVTSYFTITTATNNIVFDLSSALNVDSVLYKGNKISFQKIANNGLQINFPATIANGQRDSVSIFYKGIPPNEGFGSFNLSTHNGTPILWTLSEPYGSRSWWPCKDLLTDKADSIDITVRNPTAYISSSNGLPVNEFVTGNTRVTTWKHRYPIATYLVAIAVTNYVIDADAVVMPSRTMPLVMYAFPESAATFKTATAIAKITLPAFSNLFTEYPFVKERYAQTQFLFGGGMEHQTNSFIGSTGAGLIAHELAHQWFGDKVTTGSWQHLWLNEGFATYSEYLYNELANPGATLAQLQSWSNVITSAPGGSVFIPDTTNINRMFDWRLTYLKAGYLVHMLRWKLGDSAFFKGVRRYLNDPQLAYKSAQTADLQRNLEAESGQSLTEFFKDWFYGEGYPNYEASWSQQANNQVKIQLNQTPSHSSVSFYEMPVPLQFKSATRDTIIRVNHSLNGQVFTINPGFRADTVLIDPQLWILAKTKTAKKNNISVTELTIYPNPVQTEFTFDYPQNIKNLNLQVYNALGQLMLIINPANTYSVNTHAWPSGVYWLRATGNDFKQAKKFIVVKQ